ncbi:CRTAC1 family protein [Sulfitobacter sp. HNIBRBA2951]|uniref:CRTAC1 family protein n=1 Tax=Sulfitobacter aquimarinus TaxID=3158557 RepID=UPI0032E02AE7
MAFAAGIAQAAPKFEDMSDRLPPHVYGGGWEHFVGGGVAVFDCNNDALPDIFAAGGANPATLIRNTGDFVFDPVAIKPMTGVTGAYPIDIDADGLIDLFVMRAGANVILRGTGACGFEDVTQDWMPAQANAWTTAFTAWWEGGARPVFALGNYVDRADPDGPFEACDDNRILRWEGAAYVAEDLTPGFCPLSILAARDARGRMALRLSNDRHYYVKGGYEQMWNIAERRFLGQDDGWPRVSLWGMGIASRDLNGDGRDDVMLTSMGDQVLHFGQADGGYRAADFSLGTYAQRPHVGGDGRPSTGWHAEFGDVDNDGRADLFIAKGNVDQMPGMAMDDPNNLLMQRSDGRFEEVSANAGVASLTRSRGAALVDFDLDGRLDLIVSNRRAPLELYRNVTPETGKWITVEVRQAGGNRNAIGAVISVQSGDRSQSIQQVIGGGHAGGQLLPRHFGLGDAATARITVAWPDGTMTQVQAAAGARVVVEKP